MRIVTAPPSLLSVRGTPHMGVACVLMERRSFRRTATFCDAETLELRGRLMQNRELQRIALAIKDYEPYRMYVASPLSSVPLSLLGRSR